MRNSSNDIRTFAPFNPSRIKSMGRDKVLVRRRPIEFKVGMIYVPENSRFVDRNDIADVIAVGSGVEHFSAGDRVLLPEVLDVLGKFTHEGNTYSIVHKDTIEVVQDD